MESDDSLLALANHSLKFLGQPNRIHEIQHCCEIIAINLHLSDGACVRDRVRQLRSNQVLSIVEKAISKFKGKSVDSIPSLLKEIENELALLQSVPMKELVVTSPTPLPLGFVKDYGSKCVIERQTLDFQTNAALSSVAEKQMKEYFELASGYLPPLTNLIWVCCTIHARDAFFAFQEFLGLVSRFFALVNFECVGQSIQPLSNTPLTNLRPSRSVFAFEKGNMVEWIVVDVPEPYVIGAKLLDAVRFKKILDEMYYPLANGNLRDLLLESLDVYSSAVTETDAAFAFLKYWIVVETIAALRELVPEKILKERVRKYFINKSPAFESEIDVTLQKRNSMVHDGEWESIGHHDLVFSKLLADLMLGVLWKFALEKRSIRTVKAIFENSGLPERELDAIKEAIEYLKASK